MKRKRKVSGLQWLCGLIAEDEVASVRSSIATLDTLSTTARSTSTAPTSIAPSSLAAPSPYVNKSASASAAALASANTFELLLSLDIALELIHADREALKRVQTFAAYPGHYGTRVRDTAEEIFVLLLQALAERHLTPGFRAASISSGRMCGWLSSIAISTTGPSS